MGKGTVREACRARWGRAFCLLVPLSLCHAEVLAEGQPEITAHASKQISALLQEKALRTPAQRKLDSNLLMEAKRRRGDAIFSAVPHLRTGVRMAAGETVLVDIQALVSGDLLAEIELVGGTVVSVLPQYRAIRARVPIGAMEGLAGLADVISIRPALPPVTNQINVSQGDVAHQALDARITFGVDGTGVKLCVLSDGVDALASLQMSGDLPPVVEVLPGQAGSGSEGTALLEIATDLAPGADLAFATALGGQAPFAQNILDLRFVAGCDVLVDDVFYFAEPVFQDGVIAQAIETVTADGALFFSSAGNAGSLKKGSAGVWEGDFVPTSPPPLLAALGAAHDFGGGINFNTITADPPFAIALHWSDPVGASGNDYDLFLLDPTRSVVIAQSTAFQDGNDDPIEIIGSPPPFDDTGLTLVVIQNTGAADRFLHLNTIRGRLATATNGQLNGHAAAESAFAVAAVFVGTAGGGAFTGGPTNPVENFSSDGPRQIFYEADGTPVTPGDVSASGGEFRSKPDVAAADGVTTATPGFKTFFGTSASAPHAAAIAALLLEADPSLTTASLRNLLLSTALDIEDPGVDQNSGVGIIDAFGAVEALTSAASADLSVTKADDVDPVTVGDAVVYTVTVSNAGPDTAVGVQLTDTLPTGVSFVSVAASQGGCGAPASGVLSCSLGDLTSGSSATVTVAVTTTSAGTPTNTASVISSTPDPDGSDNAAAETTTVVAVPESDLSVTKTDVVDPVSAGDDVTYTLVVSNAGPDEATSVVLSDNLPAGTTFVSAVSTQGSCDAPAGSVLSCNLSTLASGANATVTLVVTATSVGTLNNTASVSSATADPVGGNNADNETTTVTSPLPQADISVTKVDATDPVTVGENITYTITVSNSGPDTAGTVTLSDTLPSGVSLVSFSTTSGFCFLQSGTLSCSFFFIPSGGSAVVTLVVNADEAGTVTNTVVVDSPSDGRVVSEDPVDDNNTASETTTVQPVATFADLSVSKADAVDPIAVGEDITYTVTVSNAGPDPAVAVQLSDTLPTGAFVSATPSQGSCAAPADGILNCGLGDLASGASAIVTVVITATEAGTLVNTASVSSATDDPNNGNNTDAEATTVEALPQADLSVTKTDSVDPVTVGDDVTYTLTVSNAGPDTATAVQVSDNLPAGVTFVSATATQGTCSGPVAGVVSCLPGDLAAGASATVTVVVTTTGAGTLTNTASVSTTTLDPEPANDASSETTTVLALPEADLSVTKVDGVDPVTVGDDITYTVTVTNAGPDPAASVLLTDTLPGATFVSSTPSQGSCSGPSGGVLSCNLGDLASGASATVTVVVTSTTVGTAVNSVSVTSSTVDPDATDNSDVETTQVQALSEANLSVTKVDADDPVTVGDDVTYTVTVSNAGPDTAVATQMLDTLPAGVSFMSATPSQGSCPAPAGGVLSCALGDLASGAGATVTVVVTSTGAGTLSNSVSVASSTADPDPANNSAVETTVVEGLPQADLSVTKVDALDPVTVGDDVTYTVTVSNGGPDTALSVALSDALPSAATFVSATPSQGACGTPAGGTLGCALGDLAGGASATVTIIVTSTSAGTLSNTASVSSAILDPITANNSATETTDVLALPLADLSVTKVDAQDPVTLGDNVTYTVTVTNTGPDTAEAVSLSDTLPGAATFVSATPSQGICGAPVSDIVTCALGEVGAAANATVTFVVASTAPGTLTNTATVSSATGDPNGSNNTASETTTVLALPEADLSLTKADTADPVDVGQNVTYTLTVSNAGPDTAESATVTDTLPAGVSFVSATPTQGTCGAPAGGVLSCALGNLASGASAVVTVVVTANSVGTSINTASVASATADPSPGNDSDSESTTVTSLLPQADISVSKTDSADPVTVGDNLTYTITVSNLGPDTSGQVNVVDTLPSGVTFVSATASHGFCLAPVGGALQCFLFFIPSGVDANVTVVVTTQQAGVLSNSVIVESPLDGRAVSEDPNPDNNDATESTTVLP